MDTTLTPFLVYGFSSALLMGLGCYSLVAQSDVIRKILAWNVVGSGIFLSFGAISSRNVGDGGADPLPQAVVITGIVVAVSSTALAIALTRQVRFDAEKNRPKESAESEDNG